MAEIECQAWQLDNNGIVWKTWDCKECPTLMWSEACNEAAGRRIKVLQAEAVKARRILIRDLRRRRRTLKSQLVWTSKRISEAVRADYMARRGEVREDG